MQYDLSLNSGPKDSTSKGQCIEGDLFPRVFGLDSAYTEYSASTYEAVKYDPALDVFISAGNTYINPDWANFSNEHVPIGMIHVYPLSISRQP